jgi:hypothetical protein
MKIEPTEKYSGSREQNVLNETLKRFTFTFSHLCGSHYTLKHGDN